MAISVVIVAIVLSIFSEHVFSAWVIGFFDDWAIPLSAAAALILAYVATINILETRRIREEDRMLKAIDEIRDWAHETLKLMYSAYNPNEEERRKVRAFFPVQQLAGASILSLAGMFGEKIVKKVNATKVPLHNFDKVIHDAELLKDESTCEELKKSLTDLLQVVYDQKIKLLPTSGIYEMWKRQE
jgi:hypothetical protein